MTDYGVTVNGFVIKDLATIREECQNGIRVNTDAGMKLTDRSSAGQMEAVFSEKIAEQWEVAQAVYSSQYPDTATGFSLDEGCSITGTTRDGETKSAGTAEVELDASTTLSAGAVAHASSRPSDRFVTTAAAVNSTGGSLWVEVAFEAESAGAIVINGETATGLDNGDLDTIAEAQTGWTGVQNADAFVTGTDVEEDDDLRFKREEELEAQGSTNVESIKADVLRVDGVIDCSVYENVSDTTDSDGLPPHSIHVITRGGAAADIAQGIFDTKAAGIDTYGSISTVVTDTEGINHVINYDAATAVTLYVDVDCIIDARKFVGADVVKTQIETYIESLGVGDDVYVTQVECAATNGTFVLSFNTDTEIDTATTPILTDDWTIENDEYAQTDVANIRVYVDGVLQT